MDTADESERVTNAVEETNVVPHWRGLDEFSSMKIIDIKYRYAKCEHKLCYIYFLIVLSLYTVF
jgi:hypothetical protein